jgi:hypothetical protein
MVKKSDEADAQAEEKMKTFVPAETFTGWPMPYKANRRGVVFLKGVESEPVPVSFIALMRDKGLVAEKGAGDVAGGASAGETILAIGAN